jgi:hypothetical protein
MKLAAHTLHLPQSIKAAALKLAKEDGVSLNQWIALAVAQKVSAVGTVEFLEKRQSRADFPAFKRIMKRKGGEPPRQGDEKN